jgi:hypothetical protein
MKTSHTTTTTTTTTSVIVRAEAEFKFRGGKPDNFQLGEGATNQNHLKKLSKIYLSKFFLHVSRCHRGARALLVPSSSTTGYI